MRIAIVAGELSGDQLGESLVLELKKTYPNAIIEGIGGPKMIANGFKSLFSMEALSVMGVFEVLSNLKQILSIRKNLIKYLLKNKPDIYIGIDAPDFNLPIERKLRKHNIKTLHYVSPSVWAWREYRLKKIKEATNSILSILPFEEEYYKKHNHRAIFVGHPLAKQIPVNIDKKIYKNKLGFSEQTPLLAVLPGSRKAEVSRLLPVFLDSIKKLKDEGFDFQVAIPIAKNSLNTFFDQNKDKIEKLNIKLFKGQSHDVLKGADFCLLASGTATLETMLCKLPMVVAYKVSKVSEFFARRLLKITSFSLPNILYGKELVPEYIQQDCTSENLACKLREYFTNTEEVSNLLEKYNQIHNQLIVDTNKIIISEIKRLL